MVQSPKHKLILEVPDGGKRVLLHTCCAPCSSAIIEIMLQQDIIPTIFFSNANIFPYGEYTHRKDECLRYAGSKGLTVIDDDYDHEDWRSIARGLENEPEKGARCMECFKYRLLRAAGYASEHGYDTLTTTLASSRWKDLEQVNTAGAWACSQVSGVTWWGQNWRKGGLQDRRNQIIREMDFYNQLYCGCEYSLRTSPAMKEKTDISDTDTQ